MARVPASSPRPFPRIAASLLLGAFGLFSEVRAESLSIAVPEFSKEMNFLGDTSPAALIVRSGVSRALVARIAGSEIPARGVSYRLSLADSVSTDASLTEWKFRIRPDAIFSNGQPVSALDVMFSLERCQAESLLPESVSGYRVSVEKSPLGIEQQFVVVSLSAPPAVSDAFPLPLADCPIIERKSGLVFGEQLGIGTNGIFAGEFEVRDFELGREYTLKRARGRQTVAEEVTVRAIRDPRHALTALRTGTVDATFLIDTEVLGLAANDPTLLVTQCFGKTVIVRKGLQLPCETYLRLGEVRYAS